MKLALKEGDQPKKNHIPPTSLQQPTHPSSVRPTSGWVQFTTYSEAVVLKLGAWGSQVEKCPSIQST